MAREQIQHFTTPGGIHYSPASEHSMEMARWETKPKADGSVTQEMIDEMRRAGLHHGTFEYREFPKMLYKAEQTPQGIKLIANVTVGSEQEQRNFESRGYRTRQEDALGVVETANTAVATAAAERAFSDRRMSSKAQAEAETLDQSTARHLGEIPRKPVKPRGRPRKPVVPAVE